MKRAISFRSLINENSQRNRINLRIKNRSIFLGEDIGYAVSNFTINITS